LAEGTPATLLIFDDVEGIPKTKRLALERFQQSALETGRKHRVHVLSIFHRAASGNSTKTSIGEANGLLIFPKASASNLTYLLKRYFNLSPKLKSLLADGWGRWCLIRTDGSPAYILGQKRAAIYNHDEVEDAIKQRELIDRKLAHKSAAAVVESTSRQHPMDDYTTSKQRMMN
jgi:hypothetical protein